MESGHCDILVIGTGIAGLTAAIKAAEAKLNVTIITRAKRPEETNTHWAQGGIIYSKDSWDDKSLLASDIQKASAYTSYDKAIDELVNRGAQILEEILIQKAETDFSKSLGKLSFTMEAAHSSERIIYKDDCTGKSIQSF